MADDLNQYDISIVMAAEIAYRLSSFIFPAHIKSDLVKKKEHFCQWLVYVRW